MCRHGKPSVVSLFNNQAYHNPAISLGAAMSALFAFTMNSSEASIETTNHPLPPSHAQQVDNTLLKTFQSKSLAHVI